jgi:UDP-N-acetylmuramate dehydrogenase
MNGGSQRKGIGEHLVEAVCLDAEGNRVVLSKEDCAFAYRRSRLQNLPLVVVEATFRFDRGDPARIRREMIGIMAARRRKFPIKLPNCGSVFVSDPAMYATVGPPGRAIDEAGLLGRRIGEAQISPRHGNFIVNLGAARSSDVLALIDLIRRTVHSRTGFWMDCEVRHVLQDGRLRPAHESVLER